MVQSLVHVLWCKASVTNELCNKKMCLKIFVVVIPKGAPTNPSLCMTPTMKLNSAAFTDYIL